MTKEQILKHYCLEYKDWAENPERRDRYYWLSGFLSDVEISIGPIHIKMEQRDLPKECTTNEKPV